jgi:repressor LexA
MEGLTEKQQAVYDYIKTFIASNGWPPSITEIAQRFAICPTVVKVNYLGSLERKGYIYTTPGKARAIRILK